MCVCVSLCVGVCVCGCVRVRSVPYNQKDAISITALTVCPMIHSLLFFSGVNCIIRFAAKVWVHYDK